VEDLRAKLTTATATIQEQQQAFAAAATAAAGGMGSTSASNSNTPQRKAHRGSTSTGGSTLKKPPTMVSSSRLLLTPGGAAGAANRRGGEPEGPLFRYEGAGTDISAVHGLMTPTSRFDRANLSLDAEGADPQDAAQRSMLRVYMDNQLDLNDAEMAYYEEVVNDLASQVESMRGLLEQQQRDHESLQQAHQALQTERDALAQAEAQQLQKLQQQQEQLQQLRLLQEQQQRHHQESSQSKLPEAHVHRDQQQMVNDFLGINSADADSDADKEEHHYHHHRHRHRHHHEKVTVEDDNESFTMELLGGSSSGGGGRERSQSIGQKHALNSSFDSFHSTSDHVIHRSSTSDLQGILKEREQQVTFDFFGVVCIMFISLCFSFCLKYFFH
jgi:hypothetical protein